MINNYKGALSTSNHSLTGQIYSTKAGLASSPQLVFSTPKREFSVDDIITTQDLKDNTAKAYECIFLTLCTQYPEREDEYKTVLKVYNFNYKLAVLSIEIENMKNESKGIEELLKND